MHIVDNSGDNRSRPPAPTSPYLLKPLRSLEEAMAERSSDPGGDAVGDAASDAWGEGDGAPLRGAFRR
jgi:hypothetical protein